MTSDPSAALDRFTASLDTADPRELTYDVEALRALADGERAGAVALLAERIGAGDVRAIETALAVPLPELAPAIRALSDPTSGVSGASGPAREAAARALARFGDADAVAVLVERLAADHPIVRINAAYELAQSDDPRATDALLLALTDTEAIVRVHAWQGLLRRFGLDGLAEVRHSPLGTLFVLLCSDVPASTARGAAALRAIVAGLRAGATAASLGLDVPAPPDDAATDAFVASMRSDEAPIDTDAVRAMDPLHRAWAVAIIVAAAGRHDPRVAAALEALEALGETWALEAVRTLPESPSPG